MIADESSIRRPTNNIRHVKYFCQKAQQLIDLLATLDALGFLLVARTTENSLSSGCTVYFESQGQNCSGT